MKRKPYPLRINADILEALQRWANDDLRSVNGQIEYLLRESLINSGRFKPHSSAPVEEGEAVPLVHSDKVNSKLEKNE